MGIVHTYVSQVYVMDGAERVIMTYTPGVLRFVSSDDRKFNTNAA